MMAVLYPSTTRNLPREALWLMFGVTFAVIGGLLVTIFDTSGTTKLDTPFGILVFAVCGLFASASIARPEWRDDITAAIRLTILIHALFLFVQLAAMWVFGEQINFHEYVTGEPSRNVGGSLDNLGLGFFFRPSGLLNEPGTYAAWLLPLTTLYLVLRRYRADWVLFVALLSVFATFSSQGVVSALIVAGVILYFNRGWYSTILFPAVGMVAFITISASIWQRFVLADEFADYSANDRIMSMQQAFSTVWGNGFLFPTIDIADSTTLVYWWWYCGIFAAPLLLTFALLGFRNWRSLALMFLLLFTSKVPASAPLYWIIIGMGLGVAKLEDKPFKKRLLEKIDS